MTKEESFSQRTKKPSCLPTLEVQHKEYRTVSDHQVRHLYLLFTGSTCNTTTEAWDAKHEAEACMATELSPKALVSHLQCYYRALMKR